MWKTLLACKDAGIPTDYSHSSEPCKIYHPVLKQFVDFSKLSPSRNGRKPFVVNGTSLMVSNDDSKTSNNRKIEYLIDVCESADMECNGPICMKDRKKNKLVSLGTIKNVIYSFDRDELIVHYTNGDRCGRHNGFTNYSTEIHFECDPSINGTIGKPELFVELPCHPVFNWKTSLVCDKVTSRKSKSNGTFWFILFIVALSLLAAAFVWSPQRRERLRQATSNVMQHLTRSNSRIDEQNLLVTSNVTIPTFDQPSDGMAFGRLSDEDDDELIIA